MHSTNLFTEIADVFVQTHQQLSKTDAGLVDMQEMLSKALVQSVY